MFYAAQIVFKIMLHISTAKNIVLKPALVESYLPRQKSMLSPVLDNNCTFSEIQNDLTTYL